MCSNMGWVLGLNMHNARDILRILPNGALGNWLILVFNLRLAASGE